MPEPKIKYNYYKLVVSGPSIQQLKTCSDPMTGECWYESVPYIQIIVGTSSASIKLAAKSAFPNATKIQVTRLRSL